MNTRADRVFRVVDSDWTITSVLRIISGAVFTVSGYAMAEPQGIKRLAPKRKCKFNDDWKTDYAWIAKLPDTGMPQSLCVRLIYQYRLVVARMFAGTKRVYATLVWRRVGGPPRVGCSSMLPTEKMKLTV